MAGFSWSINCRNYILFAHFNCNFNCVLHTNSNFNDRNWRKVELLISCHLKLPLHKTYLLAWIVSDANLLTTLLCASWIGCTSVWASCSTQRNVYPTAASSRASKNGSQSRTSCQICETHAKGRTKSCCKATRALKGNISQRYSEQTLPPKGK